MISASGMATGGRVLHHLAAALPDPSNTVLFAGYQAAGTRGRGNWWTARSRSSSWARACRCTRASSRSTRCRRTPTPARSCAGCRASPPPAMTYLVHGEPAALAALEARIQRELGWPTHVAERFERRRLDGITRHDHSWTSKPRLTGATLHATVRTCSNAIDDAAVVQLYADGFHELPPRLKRRSSGTCTRRRSPGATSTTTSATRTRSRCARCSKRS